MLFPETVEAHLYILINDMKKKRKRIKKDRRPDCLKNDEDIYYKEKSEVGSETTQTKTRIISVVIDGLVSEETVNELVSWDDSHEEICEYLTELHGNNWLAYN